MSCYGYCRISTTKQNIERQARNILKEFPEAKLYSEAFTGTKIRNRPKWNQLLRVVKLGDTIVFDSVSRMSRNADDGINTYFDLVDKGINLVFLKEHYIDSDIYKESLKDKIELHGTDEDEIFKGLNNYFRRLAIRQIRIAFEQSEKEVTDLHQRTREGIETARLRGKQIGRTAGKKYETNKSKSAKEFIKKRNRSFGGQLTNEETWTLAGISKMTFYKYKAEIEQELENLQES